MTLHRNRWHMAYFLCNFQGFPLLWAASAKNVEKVVISRFPAEFVHVITYKQIAHGLFPLQISRISFALGGFCQTAEQVAVSILSMVFFCRFLVFPLLWGAPSGKTAEKVVISALQESLIFMISLR